MRVISSIIYMCIPETHPLARYPYNHSSCTNPPTPHPSIRPLAPPLSPSPSHQTLTIQNRPFSTLFLTSTPCAISTCTPVPGSELSVRRLRRVSRHSSCVTTRTTSARVGVVGEFRGEVVGVWLEMRVLSQSCKRAVRLMYQIKRNDE